MKLNGEHTMASLKIIRYFFIKIVFIPHAGYSYKETIMVHCIQCCKWIILLHLPTFFSSGIVGCICWPLGSMQENNKNVMIQHFKHCDINIIFLCKVRVDIKQWGTTLVKSFCMHLGSAGISDKCRMFLWNCYKPLAQLAKKCFSLLIRENVFIICHYINSHTDRTWRWLCKTTSPIFHGGTAWASAHTTVPSPVFILFFWSNIVWNWSLVVSWWFWRCGCCVL